MKQQNTLRAVTGYFSIDSQKTLISSSTTLVKPLSGEGGGGARFTWGLGVIFLPALESENKVSRAQTPCHLSALLHVS